MEIGVGAECGKEKGGKTLLSPGGMNTEGIHEIERMGCHLKCTDGVVAKRSDDVPFLFPLSTTVVAAAAVG